MRRSPATSVTSQRHTSPLSREDARLPCWEASTISKRPITLRVRSFAVRGTPRGDAGSLRPGNATTRRPASARAAFWQRTLRRPALGRVSEACQLVQRSPRTTVSSWPPEAAATPLLVGHRSATDQPGDCTPLGGAGQRRSPGQWPNERRYGCPVPPASECEASLSSPSCTIACGTDKSRSNQVGCTTPSPRPGTSTAHSVAGLGAEGLDSAETVGTAHCGMPPGAHVALAGLHSDERRRRKPLSATKIVEPSCPATPRGRGR
jgi:hypothetical protein